MTAIVWLTRDLRAHGHPALRAALDGSERVVPVFCLDDRLLHGRHASGPARSSCWRASTTWRRRCARAAAAS